MTDMTAQKTAAVSRPSRLWRAWDSDFAWSFRHSPVAVVSLAVTLTLMLAAVFAPLIAPHDPFNPATLNLMNGFTPPSTPNAFTGDTFWLGTDDQGRDGPGPGSASTCPATVSENTPRARPKTPANPRTRVSIRD